MSLKNRHHYYFQEPCPLFHLQVDEVIRQYVKSFFLFDRKAQTRFISPVPIFYLNIKHITLCLKSKIN